MSRGEAITVYSKQRQATAEKCDATTLPLLKGAEQFEIKSSGSERQRMTENNDTVFLCVFSDS